MKVIVQVCKDLSIEFERAHLLIHGTRIERKNPSGAKTTFIFFSDDAFSKDVNTHFAKTSFNAPLDLFCSVQTSLSYQKAYLKGLKQETSSGCITCDVCNGRIKKVQFYTSSYFHNFHDDMQAMAINN